MEQAPGCDTDRGHHPLPSYDKNLDEIPNI